MVVKRLLRTKIMVVLVIVVILTMALPLSAHAQARTHVVQRGDTLYSIARRYSTSVQAIMSANGLSNRNFIWVGQRLTIPGSGGGGSSSGGGTSSSGGVYIVRRGDTLYAIARRHGTSVQAIMNANGLRNGNLIWVGQRLTIPGSSGGGGSSSGGGGTQGGGTIPSSGSVHIVSRGETLASIARRYGTSVAAIATLNGLRNPNLIYVGQRLNIPKGGSSTGGGTTPPSSGGGAKWIDIDLSSQRLRAYSGNTVLRTMVVSTGIARYPTPPGRFRIYSKYRSIAMSGPGYYLPGVPHSMFFYRGYAIHGTYWHNNFGTPMSHGCVNLTRADAAWLYGWAPIGTLVVIHW
jgi:LysM repeat protein